MWFDVLLLAGLVFTPVTVPLLRSEYGKVGGIQGGMPCT